MARQCRVHEDAIRRCLRRLMALNLVRAQVCRGATTVYVLTPLAAWKPASSGSHPSEDKGAPSLSGGASEKKGGGSSEHKGDEGIP